MDGQEQQPVTSAEQLKALLALRMCSDPWPTGKVTDMATIDEFLTTDI